MYNGNIDNPGGGTAITFPSTLSALSSTAKVPSVESYNFGIEQQLPAAMIFGVSYVGNIARHLPYTRNLNQVPMGTLLNTTANLNALRPYPGYADINLRDLSDNSNYNSLQATLNRRFSNGLAFGVSYTFSKTMDKVGAAATNGGNIGGGAPQDSYHPFAQVALASIDVPHVLSVNYIYSLPFFAKSSNVFASKVLGGWEISGITTAQSGFPYSITVPVDIGRIGASSALASLTGNPNLASDQRTPSHWFNTGVFLSPAQMKAGQFGNSGRDILRGPGFQNWDVTLMKNFSVKEALHFQFRAESFNVFNHTNFTSLNTTVAFDGSGNPTSGFGAVNAAGPGRTLEFALKMTF